jgi:hypothetical protein
MNYNINYKIFDLGGSFFKIYCSKKNEIIRIPMFQDKIIKLNDIKKIITENIDINDEAIYFSSQMHGFVLFDENYNNISDFITWKNSSSNNILDNSLFDNFYLTGLKKRNDLPINNLNEYIINNNLKNMKLYVKHITEAILDNESIKKSKCHSTMACGTGFYDIFNKKYIDTYIQYFKDKYNIELIFDTVIHKLDISGNINFNNKKIIVYTGIGDFQASLYGCGLDNNSLIINMATGSQIAKIVNVNINDVYLSQYSYRPYFNDTYLQCFTHIPSGRFLNIFVNFFKELNIDLWKYFEDINNEDINNSSLNVSTNIFSINGISINGVTENNFFIKELVISIIKNYVKQYIDIIKNNFDMSNINKILLSGGIPKKIEVIKKIIEKEFNKEVIINDIDDDSLIGVKNLI